MKRVEVVVSCWGGQNRLYTDLLRLQMSSLALFPPENPVQYTVYTCVDDDHTTQAVWEFRTHGHLPDSVKFEVRYMDRRALMRRAIARNDAALRTEADIVWYTDCDYLFGLDCLDKLSEMDLPAQLVYPREINISRTHAVGDAQHRAAGRGGVVNALNEKDAFTIMRVNRAFGGVQICDADLVREKGYARGKQKPANEWQRCTCDKTARSEWDVKSTSIDLPGIYRIRHTEITYSKPHKIVT